MSQTASELPPDDSIGEENIIDADQDMLLSLLKMEGHRAILKGILKSLAAGNLINISDEDINRFKIQVENIVKDIINPNNESVIYTYVKAVKNCEDIGKLIIRKFDNALFLSKKFLIPDASVRKQSEAQEIYEERLDECRDEIGNLLAEFKEF